MKKIGIIGRSGVGKSYISAFFADKGALVIDGDKVAHRLLDSPDLKRALAENFGKAILKDSTVDRKALAKIVFSDRSKLDLLNSITHGAICDEFDRLISQSSAALAVIDAAALLESGYKCDVFIAVVSSDDVCIKRIIERDGITEEAAAVRLGAQHPDSFYTQNADYVIRNDGGDLRDILEEIYEKII